MSVTRSISLDAPAADVWALIADPAGLARWLADRVDLDIRPGGAGTMALPEGERSVLVTDIEDGRRVSFLWWGDALSSVDLTLSEGPDGTELVVVERLLAPPEHAEAARASMSMTWGCAFALLSQVLHQGCCVAVAATV